MRPCYETDGCSVWRLSIVIHRVFPDNSTDVWSIRSRFRIPQRRQIYHPHRHSSAFWVQLLFASALHRGGCGGCLVIYIIQNRNFIKYETFLMCYYAWQSERTVCGTHASACGHVRVHARCNDANHILQALLFI